MALVLCAINVSFLTTPPLFEMFPDGAMVSFAVETAIASAVIITIGPRLLLKLGLLIQRIENALLGECEVKLENELQSDALLAPIHGRRECGLGFSEFFR